jgi:hypothetical protein
MGVHEGDASRAHERAQAQEGPHVERSPHRDRDGGEAGAPRLGEEPAPGLAGDQRVPAVVEQPPDLTEDPELLSAEAEGRFGVKDQSRRRRRHAVAV